jgi:hypothetical protein
MAVAFISPAVNGYRKTPGSIRFENHNGGLARRDLDSDIVPWRCKATASSLVQRSSITSPLVIRVACSGTTTSRFTMRNSITWSGAIWAAADPISAVDKNQPTASRPKPKLRHELMIPSNLATDVNSITPPHVTIRLSDISGRLSYELSRGG